MADIFVPVVTKIVTTDGSLRSNLFALAAEHLGDATQWNRIAALNGLTDPFPAGMVEIKIPPKNDAAANGGILGQ